MTHVEIGNAIIQRLNSRGLKAFLTVSASGSVYVHVEVSRQKVRIADHRRRRRWCQYNIRTDLQEGRRLRVAGRWVYIFTARDIKKLCWHIERDYPAKVKNAHAKKREFN